MTRLLCLLLLCGTIGRATIALVDHTCAGGGPAGAPGTSTGITTTGATLLVLTVGNNSGSSIADTPTDSKGNTWHALVSYAGFDGISTAIWYAWDHGGSALSVGSSHTVTTQGSYVGFCLTAWSGTQTSSDPFDQESGNGTGQDATIVVSSITPSVDNSLAITSVATTDALPFMINGSFTVIDSIGLNPGVSVGNGVAYWIQTTAAAAGPTWSVNNATASITVAIASFKPATGGGGGETVTRRRMIGQ